MSQFLWGSYFFEGVYKFIENPSRVGWTRRCFGVELNRTPRFCFMTNTFVRAIICVHEPFFPSRRQRFRVYGVAVVLRSDVAPASTCVRQGGPLRIGFNARLVLRPMSVFQFIRTC